MAEYKSYINALRQCAKEHKNELVSFAHIRTTDLCNDTADLLEKLETESDNAIPIPNGCNKRRFITWIISRTARQDTSCWRYTDGYYFRL